MGTVESPRSTMGLGIKKFYYG